VIGVYLNVVYPRGDSEDRHVCLDSVTNVFVGVPGGVAPRINRFVDPRVTVLERVWLGLRKKGGGTERRSFCTISLMRLDRWFWRWHWRWWYSGAAVEADL